MQRISDKYLHTSSKDIRYLKKALNQKKISGTSDVIDEYEKKLAHYFRIKYFVAQSSGSAAIHSALYNLNVQEGDEVLIPAIAPLPTALPLLTSRAKIVIVDSEKDGFGFDIGDLEMKVSNKAKAAIVVPLWGYPIDYGNTLKILKKFNIPLIEDCAQAHGSRWKGKHYGSFGKIACWSTHDRKSLSTGEGGFVGTFDKKLSEKVRQFGQLGYMNNRDYGVNYKLSSLQAAVGIARTDDIDDQVKIRHNNVKLIVKEISDLEVKPFPVIANSYPNYYALLIKLPYGIKRNKKFIQLLDKEGIPSDILKYKYKPLYKRQLFQRFYKSKCANTEDTIYSITSIPVHPGLSKTDLEYIVTSLRKVSKKI